MITNISRQRTPVVGVGASAGGIEALEGFFRGVPSDPGFATVVVTHLGPDRESHLHQIIARYTNLSVQIAKHNAQLKPNCVYVLSADALLGVERGRLQIREPPKGRRERKPIDVFLSALAKDLGEYSAAVILSGGDGDGTLGVKAVKERGGLTLAQVRNGDGPSHPDMPNSAISTGFVDFAVHADQMGAKLAQFAKDLSMLDGMVDDEDASAIVMPEEPRQEIYAILRNQIGHDFSGYKTRTFLRRVQRRMQIAQLNTIEAYIERLREDQREVNALFRDLLINVTNFFRDADAFEKLKELVIPKLFENRGAEDIVRVWVPGCATGEEVFSIAILMREHLDTLRGQPRVQIFATDIDERALNVARAARYPEALLDTVPPARLERFFEKDAGSYVVAKAVRDLCIFSPHSVIRDPPFSRIDLVSCRNLLIYFGSDIQSQVLPTFHYSLRAGGYLFLGTSENISQFTDLFTPIEKKHRIFRAKEDHMGVARVPLTLRSIPRSTGAPPRSPLAPMRSVAFRQTVESQVLERFAPPHVVTNRDGEIVYYSTRTGKYLEASAGAPSRHIFHMARKGLRLDLRAAFREAVASGHGSARERVEVEDDEGRVQILSLRVEPLADPGADEPLFIVMFQDEGSILTREAADRALHRAGSTSEQIEAELRETRERLQSVVEEYETALEELKSSNEELVSVNEELQSTNEELEASKEELQSLNEELHTVNAELSGKVEALDAANADLQNLFENTQVATVFLDPNLNIRTFTPAMARVFNILPGDRGRPLTDLSSQFPLPDLADDIHAATQKGETAERRFEHAGAKKHYLVRVAPYRNADRDIEGAVVTFVDVTSLAAAELHHRTLISELNHRVKNMLTVVISLAKQTTKEAKTINAFTKTFVDRLEAMARSYELLSRDSWRDASLVELTNRELGPFPAQRLSVEGPDIRLAPREALSLGMVLHEFATNAVKYGALSGEQGKVSIHWSIDKGDRLTLEWREDAGPAPPESVTPGFGLRLVEREIGYTLNGQTEWRFAPTGLVARIKFELANGKPGGD